MGCLPCCAKKEETQPQAGALVPESPWDRFKWFCKTNRYVLMWCWGIMIGVGIALLIGGIALIATGRKSTIGAEYWYINDVYRNNDFPDFDDTTVTSPSGFVSVASPFTWYLKGANGTDTRTYNASYKVGAIPRPASGTVLSGVSLTLVQQGSWFQRAGDSVTSTIDLPSYPLTHPASPTLVLDNLCIAIEHTEHGGAWALSHESCTYPYDAISNSSYSAGATGPITLVITTSYNPILWLGKYQDTTAAQQPTIRDEEVLVVNPNTPKLFGAGAALCAVGIALLVFFACYVLPVAPDARPPWEPQVAVEVKTVA